MASSTTHPPCSICSQGRDEATGGGSQKSFCAKHLGEHRQGLSRQMDRLTLEHDQLEQNLGLNGDDHPHPLITDVDQWESKSIEKIKQVANEVRRQLKDSLAQMKRSIRESLDNMSKEFEENRRMATYTEIDLKKWTDQLEDLKEQLNKPAMIKIRHGDDERTSTHIPLIQLHLIKEKPGETL